QASPRTVTAAGSSSSTDIVASSTGRIHRCSRTGGSVGMSHPAKEAQAAAIATSVRVVLMFDSVVLRSGRNRKDPGSGRDRVERRIRAATGALQRQFAYLGGRATRRVSARGYASGSVASGAPFPAPGRNPLSVNGFSGRTRPRRSVAGPLRGGHAGLRAAPSAG